MTLKKTVLGRYRNPCFLETGTHRGDGVQLALDCGFEEVHSIEFDPVLAADARDRFAQYPGVTIHYGDSALLLGNILNGIEGPITFWLDAHADPETVAPPRPGALLPELAAIEVSGRTDCTILIDDLRVIRGGELWGNDVPEGVDGLLHILCRVNPQYVFCFEDSSIATRDILVAAPPTAMVSRTPSEPTKLAEHTARRAVDTAVQQVRATPESERDRSLGKGRGVVIPGGGLKYFPCLWVCINMLRHLGCTLPIQVWHLGTKELPEPMRRLLHQLDVDCIDAYTLRESHPARSLGGWELKPYAMLHCPFREVLLLDADNVAVRDPTYLFDTAPYQAAGAIFWPDYGRLAQDRLIWSLTGVPYRDEPEFETGQVLIDKSKCGEELRLTMWFNEYSDFWYRHVHGDKETFHLAWRKLDTPYAMPDVPIQPLDATMCQHDFEGHRVFQHRNMAKWRPRKEDNLRIPGFMHEELCLDWISQLHGQDIEKHLLGINCPSQEAIDLIGEREAIYTRVGYDTRTIQLGREGRIEGGGGREAYWHLVENVSEEKLIIYGNDGVITATLVPVTSDPGLWKGAWHAFERMPVEIRVVPDD